MESLLSTQGRSCIMELVSDVLHIEKSELLKLIFVIAVELQLK